ncbi:MAG: hypothetical protein ACRDXC_12955 [Acidimicrobiales bacterium]
MFETMLRGWRAQQKSRGLNDDTADDRGLLVRRFFESTNEYPWCWTPSHVDELTLSLPAKRHLAPSTIRDYQANLRLFSEYLTDARYGWVQECEESFGALPMAICDEWNTIVHLNNYEGNPEVRPFSRDELQPFLDFADDQVQRAATEKRKGALASWCRERHPWTLI